MINELSLIDRAKDLAMLVHVNQKRKSGKPYFIHPFKVFQRAKALNLPKDAQIVAILHDVYEDAQNKQRVAEKIKSMFNEKVLYFILLLSHETGSDYNRYLLNLAKKSELALNIKLLDILENLKDNPTEKQRLKYKEAIKYLLSNNINIDEKILEQFEKL